jgi:hypothetical protein
MNYSDIGFALIAVALFATGVWAESNDDDPQIGRAGVWGCTFDATGWFVLMLVDRFGILP